MQIRNDLKEILYEVFELGRRFQKRYGHSENIEDWIEENEDKILALGKPEPLAKNKQFDNSCELDKQGLACWCDVKLDDYKTCPYNNKQE